MYVLLSVFILWLNVFLYCVSISWFCFVVKLEPPSRETTIKVFQLITASVVFFKDLFCYYFFKEILMSYPDIIEQYNIAKIQLLLHQCKHLYQLPQTLKNIMLKILMSTR